MPRSKWRAELVPPKTIRRRAARLANDALDARNRLLARLQGILRKVVIKQSMPLMFETFKQQPVLSYNASCRQITFSASRAVRAPPNLNHADTS